ncbi:MAG TPA: flagellin [Rhizomicrobium sp.]|jgi:flagellar hook-associated protein 3 FlgL|nr:flagellin [Rhizomicrobium sp.]
MIGRVATNNQAQILLAQLLQNESNLNKSQEQVASGKVANTYAGMGDKAAVLEAARSAQAHADAIQSATQLAVNQADLQDTQTTSLANLADQLRQAVTKALADDDASTLMSQAQSIFDQAKQILNSKDANGNYLYGGEKDTTAPVNVDSLADLAALPSVSDAFSNGTIKKSVNIGGGQTVQVGMLASDLGTQLFQSLADLANFNSGANGPFGDTVNTVQSNFLTTQVQAAQAANQNLNNQAAANGFVYNHLNDVIDQQKSTATLYKGFVSTLEDVDMGTAITQLNQNQVALQAAVQVTAQLSQVSLLNYLPSA